MSRPLPEKIRPALHDADSAHPHRGPWFGHGGAEAVDHLTGKRRLLLVRRRARSPEAPLEAVPGVEQRRVGGPLEDRAAGLVAAFEWVADGYVGCEGRLKAPYLRLELEREVEAYGEIAGGQAYRPLEPLPPLFLADGVGVLDGGAFAGIERELAVVVREEQPHLLGRVPVQLRPEVHRLDRVALAGDRLDVELVPGEGVLPVVAVRAGRVVRIAVHRDLHQVPGHGLVARVVERAPDPAPVRLPDVRELGDLPLDDQASTGRQPLDRHGRVAMQRHVPGVPQFVVLLEFLPDRAAGREHRLRATREVLGRLVPAPFDVAHVRRIESHARGELLLGHTAVDPPLRKCRHELVSGPLDGRGGHHRCPLRDETFSVAVSKCPQGASSALPTDTLTKPATPQLSVRTPSPTAFGRISHPLVQLVRLASTRYGGSS